jgi:DNA-binding transcriptional ArsR family regulator
VSDVFEAIATPARRAILDELVERDGQTLFELCKRLAMKHQLGLTRQAISQHLEVLESAGLVTKTIVERWLKPAKKGAKK